MIGVMMMHAILSMGAQACTRSNAAWRNHMWYVRRLRRASDFAEAETEHVVRAARGG